MLDSLSEKKSFKYNVLRDLKDRVLNKVCLEYIDYSHKFIYFCVDKFFTLIHSKLPF